MKILRVDTYKDGGTVKIDTDQELYWIPETLTGPDKTIRLFKGPNYFQKEAVEVTDQQEILSLLHSITSHLDNYFHIKRRLS